MMTRFPGLMAEEPWQLCHVLFGFAPSFPKMLLDVVGVNVADERVCRNVSDYEDR